jgi:hypothetical protein
MNFESSKINQDYFLLGISKYNTIIKIENIIIGKFENSLQVSKFLTMIILTKYINLHKLYH